MADEKRRRDYGEGSVYQRASDGRWMGTLEAGWTATGTRRRITVSGKSEAEAKRKLRDKRLKIETEGLPTTRANTTVKGWADAWLEIKVQTLRPKAFNAASSAVRKWIVPTIGHKRLDLLTPADVRAVANAQHAAGRKTATAAATQRTLLNMLRAAVAEGHSVPPRVLMVPAPKAPKSDRTDLTIEETIKALEVAATIPHGIRWALALLHGPRQAEVLGLTEDSLDFENRIIRLEWQLQALPYIDRKNKALGFRVPLNFEVRHLVDSWHLTRPKSDQGIRVLPMLDPIADALQAWLPLRPANPWGLLFPTVTGRPARHKIDLEEFHAIQCTAGIGHPAGRWYHVHECRNVAATQLDEVGASDNVIQSLLGHASIVTSRGYMTAHLDAKRAAAEQVAARILPRVGAK